MKATFISLGCPKNLTDTEVVMGLLASAGWKITDNEKEASLAIINTCAFIKSAQEESIKTTLEIAKLKKKGKLKYLIIIGCLPQRFNKNISRLLPEVDAFIGSSDIYKINRIVEKLIIERKSGIISVSPHGACLFDENTPRVKATPSHTAYIKIAEGCNNRCNYCSVPSIRGTLKSRPIKSITNEVQQLAKNGLKEVIFVAQDTTSFGKDLKLKNGLATLLEKTRRIKGIKWIRVMYAYPKHLNQKLLNIMAREPKICNYIDLPLQHICDNILRHMGRPYTGKYIEKLIKKIRRTIPGISIRTTFIVGFPGETKKDHIDLKRFIERMKFDKVGFFPYSQEDGTPAAKMRGQVSKNEKNKRVKDLYKLQRQISKEINQKMLGKEIEILIEEKAENCYIGRSFREAPEIDGSIKIRARKLRPGQIVSARISKAEAYDLEAVLVT